MVSQCHGHDIGFGSAATQYRAVEFQDSVLLGVLAPCFVAVLWFTQTDIVVDFVVVVVRGSPLPPRRVDGGPDLSGLVSHGSCHDVTVSQAFHSSVSSAVAAGVC